MCNDWYLQEIWTTLEYINQYFLKQQFTSLFGKTAFMSLQEDRAFVYTCMLGL